MLRFHEDGNWMNISYSLKPSYSVSTNIQNAVPALVIFDAIGQYNIFKKHEYIYHLQI